MDATLPVALRKNAGKISRSVMLNSGSVSPMRRASSWITEMLDRAWCCGATAAGANWTQ